jgi:hypothetical protein
MITLEDAYEIIEVANDDAHQQAWDIWVQADELSESDDESDWDVAEDLREQASSEQAEYFRDNFWQLEENKITGIKHWLKEDEDFKEQFACYYGYVAFDEEFEDE